MTGQTPRTDSEPGASSPPLAAAAGREGHRPPSLISGPACALPAEITQRFTLASTDGPVDHIALACVVDHFFKMAVDRLPDDAQILVRAGHATDP